MSAAADSPPRPAPLLVVQVVIVAMNTGWNFGLIGPIVGRLAESFGVGFAAIGLLATLLSLTHTAAQLPSSVPIQRYGPFRVVRGGLVVIMLGNALALVSGAYALLAATRVVVGLGSGPLFIGGMEGSRRRGGTPLASAFGGATMLGLGGALLVGALLDDAGLPWQSGFVVAMALDAVALVVCPRDRPATGTAGEAVTWARFRGVLGSGALWRLALLYTASFGATLVIGAWIVEYVHEGGTAKGIAGGVGFAMLIASALARWVGGGLYERGTAWRVLGPGATAVAGLALVVLAFRPPLAILVAAALVVGVGLAVSFGLIFASAVRAAPAAPAAAIALVNTVASAFALAATPLGGWFFDIGRSSLLFAVLAALALAAALVNRRV